MPESTRTPVGAEEFNGSGLIQRVSQIEQAILALKERVITLEVSGVQRNRDSIERVQKDMHQEIDEMSAIQEETKQTLVELEKVVDELKDYMESQQKCAAVKAQFWDDLFNDSAKRALQVVGAALFGLLVYGIARYVEKWIGVVVPW